MIGISILEFFVLKFSLHFQDLIHVHRLLSVPIFVVDLLEKTNVVLIGKNLFVQIFRKLRCLAPLGLKFMRQACGLVDHELSFVVSQKL